MFCSGAIEVSPRGRVAIATTCMISFIPAMIYSVISQSGNSRGDVSSATASFCYRVQLHSYFTNPLSASGLRYLHHRLEIVSESRELKVPLHISIRTAVARDRSSGPVRRTARCRSLTSLVQRKSQSYFAVLVEHLKLKARLIYCSSLRPNIRLCPPLFSQPPLDR